MPTTSASLVTEFTEQFEISRASTAHALEQVYRLRGDVYCRELRYESEARCPGGLEHDAHDAHSVHALVVHRASGRPAGCVRLVSAPERGTRALPFESYYPLDALDATVRPSALCGQRYGEISRLAVHRQFRIQPVRGGASNGANTARTPRHGLISTALFVAAIVLAEQERCDHTFAMMEPRLAKLLQRSAGLRYQRIGEAIDHRGLRAPFYATTQCLLEGLSPSLHALYRTIEACLGADRVFAVAA